LFRWIRIASLLTAVLGCNTAWAEDATLYEKRFTFKEGKPFTVDPYVWAYSQQFSEMFGMPEKWIDPNLKGVLGVAWRMTNIGNVMCGYDGKEDVCKKPLSCQMDIYFDNGLPLPWNYPEITSDSVWENIISTSHLPDISNQTGIRRYLSDPARPKGIMSSGGELKYGNIGQGSSELVYFDREYQPGVGVIGYVGPGVCPKLDAAGPARMTFLRPGETEKTKRTQPAKPVHVMEFSENFLARVKKAYSAQKQESEDITDRQQGMVEDWSGLEYKDVYRFNGKPFVRDEFIWGYSKEFAEKFRMPPEWIEPELKGAQALAWRMTTIGNLYCGYSRREESCWPPLDCQMNIYLDAAAPIPWNYLHVMHDDKVLGKSSLQFLNGIAYRNVLRKYTGQDVSFHSKGILNSGGIIKYEHSKGELGFLDYYNRQLTENLQIIVHKGVCPSLNGKGNGRIDYLLQSDIDLSAERKLKTEEIRVVHRVEIPVTYLERIKQVYEKRKAANDEVLERFIRDFLNSRR
jgi:hypothetical protein